MEQMMKDIFEEAVYKFYQHPKDRVSGLHLLFQTENVNIRDYLSVSEEAEILLSDNSKGDKAFDLFLSENPEVSAMMGVLEEEILLK